MKASNCVNNLQGKDRDQVIWENQLALNGCRVVAIPTDVKNTESNDNIPDNTHRPDNSSQNR